MALNKLSGSAYANYLQSFPSLGRAPQRPGRPCDELRDPGAGRLGARMPCRRPIHVWGQLDYQSRKADGDIEAGTMPLEALHRAARDRRERRQLGDHRRSAPAIGHQPHRAIASSATASMRDGCRSALYAVYDPGAFFVKGVTTYSWYERRLRRGTSTSPALARERLRTQRRPAIPTSGCGPSGCMPARGWRWAGPRWSRRTSTTIMSTRKLEGFTEDGGWKAPDLTVEGGKSNHSFLTGGVKWATQDRRRRSGGEPRLPLPVRQQPVALRRVLRRDPANDFDDRLGGPEEAERSLRASASAASSDRLT